MPTEGEVRVNKRDPNRKAIFTGGVWVEERGGAGPKPRPDWGQGAMELPDGQIVRYGSRGGTTVLAKGNGAGADGGSPDLREFEINAAARATLMDSGIRSYERAKAEGYNPGSARNVFARTIEDAPIPGGNFMADVIRDKPSERARAAELQFVDGALRTTSGANAPEPEQRRATRQYFRQPGESDTVEPERALVRERFRNTAIRSAGQAYIPGVDGRGTLEEPFDLSKGQARTSIPRGVYYRDPQGNIRQNENGDKGNPIRRPAAGATRPAQPRQSSGGLRPGTVEDGYRFKGGSPGDPKNWVKV